MIDFELLNRLMNSAKNPSAGKPLDKVRSLCKRGHRWGNNGMRNCRLFKTNDTNWRVELHGNTIACITQLDDGCAHITIHNVTSWPTITTAERLSSVLGIPVWKCDNKLRAYPKNCKAPRSAVPPLVDGLMFHSGPAGVVCMNPEIITERRTRILKEPSKPVLAYLREVKKLGDVLARLEAVTFRDIEAAWLAAPSHTGVPLPMGLDTEVSTELLTLVLAKGAIMQRAPWWLQSKALANDRCKSNELQEFLKVGLRHYKDTLYSHHKVYEQYDYTFADQFEEVRHGSNTPLALAA